MKNNATHRIALTSAHERLVEKLVARGDYADPSEVVRAALRLLSASDAKREADAAELRISLDQAIRDVDAGRGVDGERYIRSMLARGSRKRRLAS